MKNRLNQLAAKTSDGISDEQSKKIEIRLRGSDAQYIFHMVQSHFLL